MPTTPLLVVSTLAVLLENKTLKTFDVASNVASLLVFIAVADIFVSLLKRKGIEFSLKVRLEGSLSREMSRRFVN